MSLHGALAEHDRTGKEVITGSIALDGSNPTAVSTGFANIDAVHLTMQTATTPDASTSVLTFDVSGSTVNIYGWKPTAVGDTGLVASDGTETVSYIIVGRRR